MHEHEIIKKFLKPLSAKDAGAMNLTDDIYYSKNKKFSISIDTYVQGIHFIDSKEPRKFLKKILRSSLSDLVCKGVTPKSYFLSFALPKNLANNSWLKKIKKILLDEQKKYKITLSGGDTVRSSKFTITIIVLGFSTKKPVFRHNSKKKDDVYVTGTCNQTVSSVYSEGFYAGYYTGYGQYTVYTYDSYGNTYVYYDQAYTYTGSCY